MLNTVLGSFSSGVAASTSSYESIATVTSTGSEASLSFTSISSSYKHLQIRTLVRLSASGTTPNDFKMQFNDATSTYRDHTLSGNGSTVTANNDTTTYFPMYNFPRTGMLASMYGVAIIDIIDYASTTKNKVFRMISGLDDNTGGNGQIWLESGLWVDTSAITKITFTPQSANFVSGSTFALYGIKG